MLNTKKGKSKQENKKKENISNFDLVESAGSSPLAEQFKKEMLKKGIKPEDIKSLNG